MVSQRKRLPDQDKNGITAAENDAVRELSNGQVDLHGLGASVEEVSASDERLTLVGARSMARGNKALVSQASDRGHEIWHLAQQAMGQVAVTRQVNGQPINDDPKLEDAADRNGAIISSWTSRAVQPMALQRQPVRSSVVQRIHEDLLPGEPGPQTNTKRLLRVDGNRLMAISNTPDQNARIDQEAAALHEIAQLGLPTIAGVDGPFDIEENGQHLRAYLMSEIQNPITLHLWFADIQIPADRIGAIQNLDTVRAQIQQILDFLNANPDQQIIDFELLIDPAGAAVIIDPIRVGEPQGDQAENAANVRDRLQGILTQIEQHQANAEANPEQPGTEADGFGDAADYGPVNYPDMFGDSGSSGSE